MAIKERKQITGTTSQIKSFAGHEGVLAFDTTTKHLHVLSGTAGETTELANKSDIPDISGKVDKTYVDQQLATKEAKGTAYSKAESDDKYSTKTEVTQGLAGKANTSHTHAVADVANLQVALDGKLGVTAKAESAKVADSANSVSWGNVTGKPSIPASPGAYITETWRSGDSWIRRYSDGFIEQGGSGKEPGTSYTITFNTPFATTQYTALAINSFNGSSEYYGVSITNRATTNISVKTGGTGRNTYLWYACGY